MIKSGRKYPSDYVKANSGLLHIVFEYRDRYTGDRWARQECVMRSLKECKEFYGLGIDCEYRIISVEEA